MSHPASHSRTYSQANDKITQMNSLSMVMGKAVKNGYRESFKVGTEGLIPQSNPKQHYDPLQIRVVNFYRFEGESDPGDECILYQIETNDGLKGLLVDAYGPYADDQTTAFMQRVEAIQKKLTQSPDGAEA